ncbi:MAG TPA: hypothetical protein PLQ56_23920 [Aggregatilineales bacterium]|jgi:hypothetical protein|nr:hypothetical protein [Aggregatilineales bacterium]
MKNQSLHKLMQGLYYPAGIGTALVLLILRVFGQQPIDQAISDISNWFGLFLILYSSLSYLANERWDKLYTWWMFLLDVVELMVVIFAFKFLGLMDVTNSPMQRAELQYFYLWLMIIPVLHFAWSIRIRFISWRLPTIYTLRLVILGLGALGGYATDAFNWLALAGLIGLTWWYIRIKVKQGEI